MSKHVLAVGGHKGGTSKTTSAVHLAAALGSRGGRVLLIDLDPQGATTALLRGRALEAGQPGAVDTLLRRVPLAEVAVVDVLPGVDLVGAGDELARADLALAGEVGRETTLSRAIEALPRGRWDAVVLDCPPALSLLTVNALVAAAAVVVPVPPAYLPIAAVRLFAETVETVRARLNRRLRGPWYFLALVDARERTAGEARELLRKFAGDDLLRAEVRVDARLKGPPTNGRLPRGRAAADLAAVAAETFKRLNIWPAK